MSSPSSTKPIDFDELTAEVVRVMHEQSCNESLATMHVMAQRGMDFGQGAEIAKRAKKLFGRSPAIAKFVGHRPYTQAEATHMAQAQREQEQDEQVA